MIDIKVEQGENAETIHIVNKFDGTGGELVVEAAYLIANLMKSLKKQDAELHEDLLEIIRENPGILSGDIDTDNEEGGAMTY